MELAHLLEAYGTTQTFEKKEHLFRQGDADTNLYFIREGMLKAYYVSESGKEYVKSFLLAGEFIGSLNAVYAEKECSFGVVCLEKTSCTKLPFRVLNEAYQTDLNLAKVLIEKLMQLSMKKERREYEFLCLSAEDRFKQLLREHPALFERVSQNDIARYLGVTPVALSRMKKRVSC